ncbi:MAG: sulfite exporter TauE/SafE family protein [Gammaproteobacteria bacterium]|nr:sulfite exporter TauE/SafE family protein [Gammaproteobacteria bacterium]NIR85541.1 sulfite exporter TauE/SafE family protein [Gammaproteobacteria bacterium]NIR89800.1 sulfite exporter TauE/SafE family protein [Gammaproteobacteria bacterium]NIU06676.1 sulfite exporter TauE/SafE family protein [Gammaproteobacteria bacterium]NIV75067.1 TSUP family transporter [Gammaproteobacteria bacterium]
MDFAYIAGGFVVGIVVGLTGVGGGSLMTPFLIFVGIPPAVAVGTDLLFAAITKSFGVVAHQRKHTVWWRVVVLLALGSVPLSLLCVLLLGYLAESGADLSPIITRAISVSLILTALVLLFREHLQRAAAHRRFDGVRAFHVRWSDVMTVLAGAVLGVLVTLSSVGAGALGAALLVALNPRMPAVSVVGTDIAHAVPLTAIAGSGHLHLGTVDVALLLYLLIGSVPGIMLGARLGVGLPENIMRRALGTMLLFLGVALAL